jgi:hypothetical protein
MRNRQLGVRDSLSTGFAGPARLHISLETTAATS